MGEGQICFIISFRLCSVSVFVAVSLSVCLSRSRFLSPSHLLSLPLFLSLSLCHPSDCNRALGYPGVGSDALPYMGPSLIKRRPPP